MQLISSELTDYALHFLVWVEGARGCFELMYSLVVLRMLVPNIVFRAYIWRMRRNAKVGIYDVINGYRCMLFLPLVVLRASSSERKHFWPAARNHIIGQVFSLVVTMVSSLCGLIKSKS